MSNFFWFSKKRLQNIDVSNFGDDINPLLISKITNEEVKWVNPANQNLIQRKFQRINFAIGSIIHFATDNSNIWGAGLIEKKSKAPLKANYSAVRGPITRSVLKERGISVNEVYGDPALLLPKYFDQNEDKQYKLGIIPHYSEFDQFVRDTANVSFSNETLVIDLRKDVLEVLSDIKKCENIISSSLHGLIVPMAYNIPSVRITLYGKLYGDNMKYDDFYQSVGINTHKNIPFNFKDFNEKNFLKEIEGAEYCSLIQTDLIKIQDDLLRNKPF